MVLGYKSTGDMRVAVELSPFHGNTHIAGTLVAKDHLHRQTQSHIENSRNIVASGPGSGSSHSRCSLRGQPFFYTVNAARFAEAAGNFDLGHGADILELGRIKFDLLLSHGFELKQGAIEV